MSVYIYIHIHTHTPGINIHAYTCVHAAAREADGHVHLRTLVGGPPVHPRIRRSPKHHFDPNQTPKP